MTTDNAVIVRYRVKPGRGEENADLVRAVYQELAESEPADFRYATFVAQDGLSFVHIGVSANGMSAPLPGLGAFQRFRERLEERCEEGPSSATYSPVGAYGV